MQAAPYRRSGVDSASRDSYSTVTYSVGHGRGGGAQSTLGSACFSALLGIVVLLGATFLLWTNESNAVYAQAALSEAQLALGTGKGGLTHVVGELVADRPVEDAAFGIVAKNSLMLERNVEVYQWREHTRKEQRRISSGGRGNEVVQTTETFDYDTAWSSHEISSKRFKHEHGHRNPSWSDALSVASSAANQLPFGKSSWQAEVQLNGFALAPAIRKKATRPQALDSMDMAPARRALEGSEATVVGSSVYSSAGCARQPQVGCVRIAWTHAPLAEVSVLARQKTSGQGRKELVEWPSSSGPGYDVALVEFGDKGAYEMLAAASAEAALWTWIKRGVGILLTWFGWSMLFGPAHYLATWVPLFSGLVGCLLSLVALGIALAHSLSVIAIAWLAQRPLIAGTLFAVVAATLYYLITFLQRRRRQQGGSSSTSSSSGSAPQHPYTHVD